MQNITSTHIYKYTYRQHVDPHTLRDGPNQLHHPTLACSYIHTDIAWTHTHTHTLTDLKRLFADLGSNAAASAATGLC